MPLHKTFFGALLISVVLMVASRPVSAQTPPEMPPPAPGAPQGRGPGPGGPDGGFAFGFPPAGMVFQRSCGSCHTAEGKTLGDRAVPSTAALSALPPARIYQAITTGTMASHADGLDDKVKRDLTEFVAKRPFVDVEGTGIARMTNRCTANPLLGDLTASPAWAGWGPAATNARFQAAAGAGLNAADVPKLKLKWAFGLPGGGVTSSQPTVALGRVFIASDNRVVYAIDASSGCAYWAFHAEAAGRFAPVVAPITGYPGTRYAVLFVTGPGTAYAIDAQDGKQLWKTEMKGLHAVNASSTYHDGRLYVPFAGTETMAGANPNYECCRSRGGVAALDVNSGKVLWKVDSIPQPVEKVGVNPNGKTIWGLSGASVWNAPTVDPKRRVVYVGTGNSYGPVAADTSDSILALSIDDGRIVWRHQEFSGDSFMVGCGRSNPAGGNCPEKLGPDWDFGGASAILQTLPGGRDVLIAAGKGGIAVALDPDKKGEVIWRTQLFEGQPPSALGLVLFGGTADGVRVYYPMQQPGGGLVAVRVDTGAIEWRATIDADRRGQAGAATSMPGAVFTGGWDGVLRAVDTDGKVVWTFNAAQSFDTVNGVPAKGGSLAVTGPAIANGMLYLGAGYIGVQGGTPGNVLLAFSLQ